MKYRFIKILITAVIFIFVVSAIFIARQNWAENQNRSSENNLEENKIPDLSDISNSPAVDFSKISAVKIRNMTFNTELALTDAERTLGLSGRENLPRNKGLLFVFDQAQAWGFWMKDMKFSIDMVWIDENLKIIHIEHSVSPETFPKTFAPTAPAKFVLEVNAGIMREVGIKVGDKVAFLFD